MNVATASQPASQVSISTSGAPKERWLDGIAGALLGSWLTACIALQIPDAFPLAGVATVGLFFSRMGRIWGFAFSTLLLGYLLVENPLWLRQDLLVRGGLLLGLLNIWMMMALRVRSVPADKAPSSFESPLQDVERSLMPHSAQVKRDLDRAVADLAKERDRLAALSLELTATQEREREEQARASLLAQNLETFQQEREELLDTLEQVRAAERTLQEELAPMRLEAGELRDVLSRTLSRAQSLEEQTLLLDELKETLKKAQESAAAQQNSLEMQGGQLQNALQRLLKEQEERIALEALVQGHQGREQSWKGDLEAARQDLERQERVAEHLLQKCSQLEGLLQETQRRQEGLVSHSREIAWIAEQSFIAWQAVAAKRHQQLSEQNAQQLIAQELIDRLQHDLSNSEKALVEKQEQFEKAQEERQQMTEICAELRHQLTTIQHVLQNKEVELQVSLEARRLQAEEWEHRLNAAVAKAIAEMSTRIEGSKEIAALQEEANRLSESLQTAQAQAAHAQSLLEMQAMETTRLREQLNDPQRVETLKRASMLERQLAVKEQVIARLHAQATEMPELLKIKHQHAQLREQFEAHREAAELLVSQNHQLERQVLALEEASHALEPGLAEQQLLSQLYQTEEERAALEVEAKLSAQALRRVLTKA